MPITASGNGSWSLYQGCIVSEDLTWLHLNVVYIKCGLVPHFVLFIETEPNISAYKVNINNIMPKLSWSYFIYTFTMFHHHKVVLYSFTCRTITVRQQIMHFHCWLLLYIWRILKRVVSLKTREIINNHRKTTLYSFKVV